MSAREKEQIVLAVEALGRTVSVAQVAKSTGLNGNDVYRGLREIAAATGSNLQVVQGGEIVFSFPANFIEIYHSKDRSIWWSEVFRAVFDLCFFAARIVFGITLLITIWLFHPDNGRLLALYLLLIFSGAYFELIDGRNDFERGALGGQEKTLKKSLGLGSLSKLFSYKYREGKHDLKNVLELLKERPPVEVSSASLFNICFSYVFGDGNPNIQFEELKWQVVAEVIRQHDGAVIIEQLAPYLCCAPDDEEAIVPVLQRFNGFPRATESGNLVYLFPDLMKTEKARVRLPRFLAETPWRFSDLPFPQILPVWIVSNLLLLLGYYEFLHPDVAESFWFRFLPDGFHMWQFVFPFSLFFVVIPALRFIYIFTENAGIEERNKLRAYFAELLYKPEPELFKKLVELREYELDEKLVQSAPENVVYTTQKALDEQGLDI
ncbi:MAG: hypothetical protein JSS83_00705 [Cyanobacteria bacterium SZAS LIN-3]|nr:hypothetical protein [Cyanobacteria bacterium SZAS LIN-3]